MGDVHLHASPDLRASGRRPPAARAAATDVGSAMRLRVHHPLALPDGAVDVSDSDQAVGEHERVARHPCRPRARPTPPAATRCPGDRRRRSAPRSPVRRERRVHAVGRDHRHCRAPAASSSRRPAPPSRRRRRRRAAAHRPRRSRPGGRPLSPPGFPPAGRPRSPARRVPSGREPAATTSALAPAAGRRPGRSPAARRRPSGTPSRPVQHRAPAAAAAAAARVSGLSQPCTPPATGIRSTTDTAGTRPAATRRTQAR